MAEHEPDSMDALTSGEPGASAHLLDVAPAYEDLEARRARAGVAAALFGDSADEPAERVSVGRYEIDSRLGSGGMGVVYRAHDPDLDRPVAVKLLHSESSADDKARARMLREARALAKLSHPNVITVYDVGTDAGQVFVAMELVAGRDLRRWLDEHRDASWRKVLSLFVAAGRGLEAAHEVALVHRDFKPENVLVGDDGRVRVLDFGLARVHQPVEGPTAEDPPRGAPSGSAATTGGDRPGRGDIAHLPTAVLAQGLTETGALIGTPLYMAPELYAGRPADVRSDQFAFCASLYEGLYRQLPFGSRNLSAHIEAVRAGRVVDPPDDSPVPVGIWRAIARGLDPSPEARWRDVAALLVELERVANEPPPTQLPEPRGGLRLIAVAAVVALAVGGLMGLELGWFGESAQAQPSVVAASVGEPTSTKAPETKTPSVDTPPPEPVEPKPEPPIESPPVESSESETGAEAEPAPVAPEPELRDWCHMHEDDYTLLLRTTKRRGTFKHQDSCYKCRVEDRRDRIRTFSPRNCAGYSLCGEASADECG